MKVDVALIPATGEYEELRLHFYSLVDVCNFSVGVARKIYTCCPSIGFWTFGRIFGRSVDAYVPSLQVIEVPTHADSQLQIADVLMEVSIMERFQECANVCHLIDYGVAPEGFRLVMPLYKCNLAEWRERLPSDTSLMLPLQRLFLNIFKQVRASMRSLFVLQHVSSCIMGSGCVATCQQGCAFVRGETLTCLLRCLAVPCPLTWAVW
jgi:hypothetical protein